MGCGLQKNILLCWIFVGNKGMGDENYLFKSIETSQQVMESHRNQRYDNGGVILGWVGRMGGRGRGEGEKELGAKYW